MCGGSFAAMTENKAFALDIAVGCLLTWGTVLLLDVLGVPEVIQGLVGAWGIVVMSFFIGVIGVHYGRKEKEHED
jgi:hypothetical protein